MMGDTDCGKTKKIEMGTADQMATTPTAPPVAPLLGSGWGWGLGPNPNVVVTRKPPADGNAQKPPENRHN